MDAATLARDYNHLIAPLTSVQRDQLLAALTSFLIEDLEPEPFHVEILAAFVAGTITADEAAERIAAARANAS